MEPLERLFKEATTFHKATCLLASKYTGIKDFDADGHLPFPMIFRATDGRMFRTFFRDAKADEKWIEDADSYFSSLVVNGAFSLELHLKHLHLLIEKKEVRGHDLFKLFNGLGEFARTNLEAIFQAISAQQPLIKTGFDALNLQLGISQAWSIATVLQESAYAFEAWRYSYEKNSKFSAFAGYGEAVYAMRIISKQFKILPPVPV